MAYLVFKGTRVSIDAQHLDRFDLIGGFREMCIDKHADMDVPSDMNVSAGVVGDILHNFHELGEMLFDDELPPDEAVAERVRFADFVGAPKDLMSYLHDGIAYQRAHLKAVWPEAFEVTVRETGIRRKIAAGTAGAYEGLTLIDLPWNATSLLAEGSSCSFQPPLPEPPLARAPARVRRDAKRINSDVKARKQMLLGHLKREPFKQGDPIQLDPLVNKILEIPNVVIAGGAALGRVTGERSNDIDVFVWGLSRDGACSKVSDILGVLGNPRSAMITGNAITVACNSNVFQIVLRLYSSPSEILHGFDLPPCKALIGAEGRIYATDSFMLSVRERTFWLDPERQSSTYARRTLKYMADRKFDALVPGLDRRAVDPEIYCCADFSHMKGLALLLRLEREMRINVEKMMYQIYRTVDHNGEYVVLRRSGPAASMYAPDYAYRYAKKRALDMAENLPESDYAITASDNSIMYNLVKYVRSLMEARHGWSVLKWIKNLAHPRELDFDTSALKWVERDPSSQTVTGSFYPEHERFYATAGICV